MNYERNEDGEYVWQLGQKIPDSYTGLAEVMVDGKFRTVRTSRTVHGVVYFFEGEAQEQGEVPYCVPDDVQSWRPVDATE